MYVIQLPTSARTYYVLLEKHYALRIAHCVLRSTTYALLPTLYLLRTICCPEGRVPAEIEHQARSLLYSSSFRVWDGRLARLAVLTTLLLTAGCLGLLYLVLYCRLYLLLYY